MSATITADLRAFSAALRAVKEASRKTEAEIVNKAAKDVAFRAASFTPKTTAAKINTELKGSRMLTALAAKALNKKGKGWKTADLRKMEAAILAKRKRGIGALRAGWIPAITALGGSYRGAKQTGGSASHGSGSKATPQKLISVIRNTVATTDAKGHRNSAEHISIAVAALNVAIDYVASDRENYVRKKMMEKTLKAHSDRK